MAENLKIGDTAPEIVLLDGQGKEVRLSDFRGKKNVVLYFYPRDNTPGCTREACSFRDSHSKYRSLGAEVIGVSLDSVESHERFAGKYNLPFTLLSDENRIAATAYGVLGPGELTAKRVTFIIDKKGRIRQMFPKVDVKYHSEEVIKAIESLEQNHPSS